MASERILNVADCRSGSWCRASLDLPLARIRRCRAPQSAGAHGVHAVGAWGVKAFAGLFRIVRRCAPADCQCHSCAVPPALGAVWTLGHDWVERCAGTCDVLSLFAPGLTVTLQAWSGSALRPKARPDSRRSLSSITKGAQRGVARSVPLPVRPLRAPRSLRHIAKSLSRCSVSVLSVGPWLCHPHTRCRSASSSGARSG